jgi:hypothetical protein
MWKDFERIAVEIETDRAIRRLIHDHPDWPTEGRKRVRADKVRYQDLDEALRKYLAWDSIVEEAETLNLDRFQAEQAGNQKQAAAGAVAARLVMDQSGRALFR